MRQPALSGIVKRRFLHCVNKRGQTVQEVIQTIGIPAIELCQVITKQKTAHYSLTTYYQIARWLRMPLANVIALDAAKPKLSELVRLGMQVRGYRPSSTQDQLTTAAEVGVSVAVFRRALHGYADFTPSIRTCDRLSDWLSWTGLAPDDVASSAGMVVRYQLDGRRALVSLEVDRTIKAYPCACGRAGCMVPAHIPSGPRRKWRSDACRMWAKRRIEREARLKAESCNSPRIVRFITINERTVPVRF